MTRFSRRMKLEIRMTETDSCFASFFLQHEIQTCFFCCVLYLHFFKGFARAGLMMDKRGLFQENSEAGDSDR